MGLRKVKKQILIETPAKGLMGCLLRGFGPEVSFRVYDRSKQSIRVEWRRTRPGIRQGVLSPKVMFCDYLISNYDFDVIIRDKSAAMFRPKHGVKKPCVIDYTRAVVPIGDSPDMEETLCNGLEFTFMFAGSRDGDPILRPKDKTLPDFKLYHYDLQIEIIDKD